MRRAIRIPICVIVFLMAPLLVNAQTYVNINTASTSARAHFAKGMAAADANRLSDARSHFEMAIEADPKFAAAHLYRSGVATNGADYALHSGHAQALRESASIYIQILIDLDRAGMENDTERMMELAENLVAMYPNNPRARLVLGSMYANQKNTAMSRSAFNAAIDLDPSFPLARKVLANSFINDKPTSMVHARRQASAYMWRSVDEPDAYIVMGNVHRAEGNLKAARDSYADASSIDPENPVAHSMRGHTNSFLGDYEAARKDYKAAAELGSTIGAKTSQGNFGVNTYLHAGDVDGALAANATIIQSLLDSGLAEAETTFPIIEAYRQRAMIAMHYGKFDVAEKALNDRLGWVNKGIAQVNKPSFENNFKANVAFWNGMLAARRGDLKQARQLASQNKALSANETNPRRFEDNHQLLAAIESADGNYDAAVEHLSHANVDGVWIKYETAVANEKAGHADKAQALYKEIADWNFNSLATALVRGDVLRKIKAQPMSSN